MLTDNAAALAAYEASNELWYKQGRTVDEAKQSADLMAEATQLDPDFVQAHTFLAEADAWIHQNWDRTAARAERALAAAERAVSLAPESSQAHAALGAYYYRIAKDYEAALQHYTRARELDPDRVGTLRMTGYVARRAGRYDEAVELLTRANEISATRSTLWELGGTYQRMHRYDDARTQYEAAREVDPEHWQPRHSLAWLDVHQHGDVSTLRSFLAEQEGGFVGNRWWLAMVDRDWEAALIALEAPGNDVLSGQFGITPRSLLAGLAYRRMGDEARASESFEAAHATMEQMVAEAPDDPRTHLGLGLALAALGRTQAAIEAGRHGLDLLPPERDSMIGPSNVWGLAEIYAMAGQTDQALDAVERLLPLSHAAGPATIALDPWLDSLSDHPRFRELLGTS